MANYKVEELEGIGEKYGEMLRAADIQTTDDILRRLADKKGREGVAKETSISEKLLLEWVNHCDLMRINGVGPEYADLLEEAGVDTVKEFATRNAENLADKLDEVNAKKNLTNKVPNAETLQGWIDAAGKMEPGVSH